MEEIENDLSTYSFKRVIVLLLMLSDDKIILVQTQTKYCDMLRGDLYHPYCVCTLIRQLYVGYIRNAIKLLSHIDVMNVCLC